MRAMVPISRRQLVIALVLSAIVVVFFISEHDWIPAGLIVVTAGAGTVWQVLNARRDRPNHGDDKPTD